jgi:hypothetical protein
MQEELMLYCAISITKYFFYPKITRAFENT